MIEKYLKRRQFLKYSSAFFIFLLNACGNVSKKVKISLQNSFYPDSFKDTIPNFWQKENINFERINSEKNRNVISNSDFTLITDGWINVINLEEFSDINNRLLFEKLDKRSVDFINSFDENQRNKLFPIGVVPFAVIIKNNKDLINSAKRSWDFLLSKKLTKKIILPKSPRIIMSISKKIKSSQSLLKLKNQALLFDDRNILNWLIDSDALVAVIPYSLCLKYLKIDTRLSIVFPNQGVPLMWYLVLSRSKFNGEILNEWINSLEKRTIVDKLSNQGWYLPFNNDYSQKKFTSNTAKITGPSKECWSNSWSFPKLTFSQKINLENYWNQSLSP